MKIKVGDTVMLKYMDVYPQGLSVSCHKTYTVVDVYSDGKMQLHGVAEPQQIELFAKMVIGKVRAW